MAVLNLAQSIALGNSNVDSVNVGEIKVWPTDWPPADLFAFRSTTLGDRRVTTQGDRRITTDEL